MKVLFTLSFFVILCACATRTLDAQSALQPRLLDSYGRLIADDAGGHADNFAGQLEKETDNLGLIVCYGPSGDGAGTANYILKMIQEYLVNIRGVDPGRLQILNAGRFKDPFDVRVELWLTPIGAEPPKKRDYDPDLAKLSGKLQEFSGWDGFPDGDGGGPPQGDVTLAAFADVLKAQPNSTAYIVAFNHQDSTIGTWRRVATRIAADLHQYGISDDHIRTVFGGTLKKQEDESNTEQAAKVQLWILPKDTPLPVKEGSPEAVPTKATQIYTAENYLLKDPETERQIFKGFADVLRANEELSVCIITRPLAATVEKLSDDEPPDIDPQKLTDKWRSELTEKLGIKSGRIIVLAAAANEFNEGTIEIWIVPRGADLPDPYRTDDDPPSLRDGSSLR